MKKIWLKTPLGLAVALATSHVLASGFALNEQSISGMGSGFAGRSSSAEDASTVFGNPAGMSRLKREQVSLGAATLFAKSDISQTRSTFGGQQDGDMVPATTVPMGYYVKPIDEHWAFGVGFYVPFGLITPTKARSRPSRSSPLSAMPLTTKCRSGSVLPSTVSAVSCPGWCPIHSVLGAMMENSKAPATTRPWVSTRGSWCRLPTEPEWV
jgi:hypothetical protein